ncbi:MAG: hypothetical protein ABI461_06180 [Polyangiaceae bacterium]
MKTEQHFETSSSPETDHDAEWRERIQRALRDLRSTSTDVATPSSERAERH